MRFPVKPINAGLLIAIALQLSCTNPQTFSAQADCRYTPIKMAEWAPKTAEEGGTIRFLLVHGMNNHPFGMAHSEPELGGSTTYAGLQRTLSGDVDCEQKLRFRRLAAASQFNDFIISLSRSLNGPENEITANCPDFSIIKDPQTRLAIGYTFTRTFRATSTRPALKFYVVNWGLGAAVLKERQFGSWSNLQSRPGSIEGVASEYDPHLNKNRAYLNKYLKTDIIDWGFGDAALYLGAAGSQFRHVVSVGIDRLSAETTRNDRVAIVTHSLGSTITLQVLERGGIADTRSWRDLFAVPDRNQTIESTKQARIAFYMFANQYALLTLGRSNDVQVNAEKPLANFNAAIKKAQGSPPEPKTVVQIYAFTDPNDLLSFPLNPNEKFVSTCNVYVRNPGLTVGVIMHPGSAHLNYERNAHVLATLLNGPEKKPVLPDDCP
jgi:hypothetical protein